MGKVERKIQHGISYSIPTTTNSMSKVQWKRGQGNSNDDG